MRHPDLFASILLGHMVGDYLLQNSWMTISKGSSTLKCLAHCFVYTWIVVLFTYPFFHNSWAWYSLVFFSHFPIDRWSLADKWLSLIGGRSLKTFMQRGKDNIPKGMDFQNYHGLRAAFTGLVYAAADNTMHLVLMYYGALMLLGS